MQPKTSEDLIGQFSFRVHYRHPADVFKCSLMMTRAQKAVRWWHNSLRVNRTMIRMHSKLLNSNSASEANPLLQPLTGQFFTWRQHIRSETSHKFFEKLPQFYLPSMVLFAKWNKTACFQTKNKYSSGIYVYSHCGEFKTCCVCWVCCTKPRQNMGIFGCWV